LQEKDVEPLNGAKAHVGDSENEIAGLKSRTAGTPYAFAGLQLHNIGEAHVTPAHRNLNQVSPGRLRRAKAMSNQSMRHRSTLAAPEKCSPDLTRTFERVKREQKIADADAKAGEDASSLH
jgi:hypothetical protein